MAEQVAAAWVTGDTVCGHDGKFGRFLEANKQAYLLAVPSNQSLFDGQVPRWERVLRQAP